MSWGKIYCDTNWGENKYRTAGSIINEATPDCFQFPEFVSFKDHVRSEGATYEKMQCGIDILLFLGRSISITPQSPDNPTFSGILDTYTGATAGYSVRRLTNTYTGGLIRVRRSSDDAEQDIGYDANGEDMGIFGLLDFVNEDVNQYTSDFSSTEDLTETNGTGAAAQSVGGVDDAYKFTTITGTGQMFANTSPFSGKGGGNSFRIQADVYLPSTNAEIDKVRIWTGYGTEIFTDVTDTDTWTSIDETITITSGSTLRFQAYDGNDLTPTTTEANVFYLKNIVVTQTTADGHVTTFYDQTGNGNHATNSTASEQPLIVDGGSIIYEGATISRPAIRFDGTADALEFTELNLGDNSWFINAVYNSTRTSLEDYLMYGDSGNTRIRMYPTTARIYVSNVSYSFTIDSHRNTQQLFTFEADASRGLSVYQNGTQKGAEQTIGSGDSFDPSSFGQSQSTRTINGLVQEILIFNADQSTNRTGTEGNIDNYFRIT
jgi:hypothetical protein